ASLRQHSCRWRSNLAGEGIHTGLLRSARNDGRIKSVKIRVNPRTKPLKLLTVGDAATCCRPPL
ncbi:MAG: hypothetical protein LBT00_08805, partial [Spirochaetaceae bacterium]|nr:hypothetical protein [Spirochaetaceae bacterium]